MNRSWGLLLGCFLICACSSISTKQTGESFPLPPVAGNFPDRAPASTSERVQRDQEYETRLRKNPGEAMRLLVRYHQAQLWAESDPVKACALWLQVTSTANFPLLSLARLHATEACPAARPELASFPDPLTSTPPWLRETALRASLRRVMDPALVNSDTRAQEVDLELELAGFARTLSDRVKMIQHALKIAHEMSDSEREARAQAELEKAAPRFIADPKPDQYDRVASDLRRVRNFERAREFYKRDLERPDATEAQKVRALDGRRMSFKLEGNREAFVHATRELAQYTRSKYLEVRKQRPKASGAQIAQAMHRYVEAWIVYARATWTEGSSTEAEKLLLGMEKELKGAPGLQESQFLRARIEEEAGHLEQTVQTLAQIDIDRLQDRAFRLRYLWYRAWASRKLGRGAEAVQLLTQLTGLEDAPPNLSRDHFWLARTLKETGDAARAATELQWLTQNDPLGYYGLLAYRELGQPLPPLSTHAAAADLSLDTISNVSRFPASKPTLSSAPANPDQALFPEEKLTYEWLIATGEGDLAKRFLDQIDTARRAQLSPTQSLDELQLYARAGAYQSLFARLNDLAPEARAKILTDHPELLFPRPWAELIASASQTSHIQKELVYSIMRQESSFNPYSRSGADAFGLLQLIPKMAKEASEKIGVPFSTPEDLYQPEINIPLGTAFLKNEFDLWDGQFIAAVAAYNAGEKAVHGWMHTRDRKDALQFIEDIPYEETRAYVKLVMRNFVFYSRLNAPTSALPFPESCLNGLQDIKL